MNFRHEWTFSVRANVVKRGWGSCTKDFWFPNNRNIWKHQKMYVVKLIKFGCLIGKGERKGPIHSQKDDAQKMLTSKLTTGYLWIFGIMISSDFSSRWFEPSPKDPFLLQLKKFVRKTLQRLKIVNRFSNVNPRTGINSEEIFPTE